MRHSNSWSEAVTDQLRKLPLPYWLTCTLFGLALTLVIFLWFSAYRVSIESTFPLAFFIFAFGLAPAYNLFILGSLPGQILTLLGKFRPALQISEPEYHQIEERFLMRQMSVRAHWLTRLFFFLAAILPLILARSEGSLFLLFLTALFFLVLLSSLWLVIKIGNILICISQLQHQPLTLNLLNLKPIFALSQLTQRLAVYPLPIATVLGLFAAHILWPASQTTPTTLEWLIAVPLVLLGPILLIFSLAIFSLPIFWVRRLIIEQKELALTEIAAWQQTAYQEQDRLLASHNLAAMGELQTTLNALAAREERYRKISEWPWDGRIFREFLATLVVPILIWAIQLYTRTLIETLTK